MNSHNDTRLQYLDAIGIDVWVPRDQAPPAAAQPGPRPEGTGPAAPGAAASAPGIASPDWDALAARVAGCTACELHRTRTQTVFGTGNRDADWLIIGEAPGADEDRQGEPFVGRAGQLLNAMLAALGLARGQVYIANILKCRPPKNRDPLPQEVVCCEPYLKRQVELIRPAIILALGRIAAQNLLKSSEKVGRMRGQVYEYAGTGIPLVVTYHPAYLLRSPREKRKAWQDLCFARDVLAKRAAAD